MKATIDISDALPDRSKEAAAREGSTLRELVEQALSEALDRRAARDEEVKPSDASVAGSGLQPGRSWDLPRDLAYDEA